MIRFSTDKRHRSDLFNYESEMTETVRHWLVDQGLLVRSEFLVPSGYCDLAGIKFNPEKVAARKLAKQMRTIGSEWQVDLLVEIPDQDSGNFTRLEDLLGTADAELFGDRIRHEVDALVADRFVIKTDQGFQRRCNWLPIHERIVAVELKIDKFSEVLRQACDNLAFADESYIALPADVAERSLRHVLRMPEFVENGIGLLAVNQGNCYMIKQARRLHHQRLEGLRVHCAERFWRSRTKST